METQQDLLVIQNNKHQPRHEQQSSGWRRSEELLVFYEIKIVWFCDCSFWMFLYLKSKKIGIIPYIISLGYEVKFLYFSPGPWWVFALWVFHRAIPLQSRGWFQIEEGWSPGHAAALQHLHMKKEMKPNHSYDVTLKPHHRVPTQLTFLELWILLQPRFTFTSLWKIDKWIIKIHGQMNKHKMNRCINGW